MTTNSADRGAMNTSINASNANGAGDSFGLVASGDYTRLPKDFIWEVLVSGGVYSALSVNLEGSLDNVNWYTLDSSTATGGEARAVLNKPFRYVRGNKVSSTTSSGTPVVTVRFTF